VGGKEKLCDKMNKIENAVKGVETELG